jgi:hypothetical protein
MRKFKLCFILTSLFLVLSRATPQDQPSIFISTFKTLCLDGNGKLDSIRDWAAQHGMNEVTGADARKVYTGGIENGHAWWVKVDDTFLVIASRTPTAACAVFTSAANPIQLQEYIRQLPNASSGRWANVSPLPDKDETGPFGYRRGRAILFSMAGGANTLLVTSIFNEFPGGPYQATLQASRSAGGR